MEVIAELNRIQRTQLKTVLLSVSPTSKKGVPLASHQPTLPIFDLATKVKGKGKNKEEKEVVHPEDILKVAEPEIEAIRKRVFDNKENTDWFVDGEDKLLDLQNALKEGSKGTPIPCPEVKLVDPDVYEAMYPVVPYLRDVDAKNGISKDRLRFRKAQNFLEDDEGSDYDMDEEDEEFLEVARKKDPTFMVSDSHFEHAIRQLTSMTEEERASLSYRRLEKPTLGSKFFNLALLSEKEFDTVVDYFREKTKASGNLAWQPQHNTHHYQQEQTDEEFEGEEDDHFSYFKRYGLQQSSSSPPPYAVFVCKTPKNDDRKILRAKKQSIKKDNLKTLRASEPKALAARKLLVNAKMKDLPAAFAKSMGQRQKLIQSYASFKASMAEGFEGSSQSQGLNSTSSDPTLSSAVSPLPNSARTNSYNSITEDTSFSFQGSSSFSLDHTYSLSSVLSAEWLMSMTSSLGMSSDLPSSNSCTTERQRVESESSMGTTLSWTSGNSSSSIRRRVESESSMDTDTTMSWTAVDPSVSGQDKYAGDLEDDDPDYEPQETDVHMQEY